MDALFIERAKNAVMATYNRFPVVLKRGEGVYVWDAEGKRYLDFVAGIAVNALGYGHPAYSQAIKAQLDTLHHVSNLYWTEPQVELAERLVKLTGLGKAFFCNSGAEGTEAAIKLCRKWAHINKGPDCHRIITMEHSFHGRTTGAITATGQPKYQKDFHPLLPGFDYVPFNDIKALKAAITPDTCAIFVEPVQGEGGVKPADPDYLKAVRALCDEHGILLGLDEVQCGFGRTGKLFAWQNYDIQPDLVWFAKALGGGLPIGALVASDKVAEAFQPGDHASTYGGNPLVCSGALAVLDVLESDGFMAQVNDTANYLKDQLEALKSRFNCVAEVRGLGLMLGMELDKPMAPYVSACMEQGLLLVSAGPNVIRFVPPLIIERQHVDEAIRIIGWALENIT